MDKERLIQVNFQLPLSALDSLSRLAEQLRLLTETAAAVRREETGGSGTAGERGESASFDPEQFLALRQGTDTPPHEAEAAVSGAGAEALSAPAVSAEVREELQEPEAAGSAPQHQENTLVEDARDDPPHALEDGRSIPLPPAETVNPEQAGAIPAVRAEAEEAVLEAPGAARDVTQQVPAVESARAEAEERELVLAAVQGEVSGGIETPLGAGTVIQAYPEAPQSRWTNVTEELVIPGPAPLTAEAVSLAFERDGRRYDNGFPLY